MPQNIEPDPDAGPKPVPPSPQVDLTSVSPDWGQISTIDCVDQTNMSSASFSLEVRDADGQPLHVRWFLDYAGKSQTSKEPLLPEGGCMDAGTGPDAICGDSVVTLANGIYPQLSMQFSQLAQLSSMSVGVHSLEVVISEEFDANPADEPINRNPSAGYSAASYKWIIEYRGSSGTCTPT